MSVKKILETKKNILIVTYGPVPTPEFQKIEGGGMRCWGLATGLRDNGHNVTVSVFNEFKQTLDQHDGIQLHNWSLDDNFKAYINTFDAVVVSYSMGDASVFIADKLEQSVTLVLDCYVPIYVEISARDSSNKADELRGYMYEIERFNHVLKRGDFFLCANEPQKHMYTGILGSLGIINPYTYRQTRILVVPFGIDQSKSRSQADDNPYLTSKGDFVLLWFGGLYPWFNFNPLIDAIVELSKRPGFKFYLVGGKNPYNGHPDFVKQYENVLSKFTELGLIGKTVFFVEWVDFDDRLKWYKHADLVVSINSPGEENVYSWRTRVMDYLWGEVPMLSNGGDPLSDELMSSGAALRTTGDTADLTQTIVGLMDHPARAAELHKKLLGVRPKYYWPVVTKTLSDQLSSESNHPFLNTLQFMSDHKITSAAPSSSNKVIRYAKKLDSYVERARQKGLRRSAKFAIDTVKTQVKAASVGKLNKKQPKFVFLSHPIDHTGAPLVLLDLISDFSTHIKPSAVHLVAPGIEHDLLTPLLGKGYKIHKMAMGLGGRFIQAGLQINSDDFVLMNTVALYQNYKDYIYWMLETGKLKHAYWFIHEDQPKTQFNNSHEIARIKRLIASSRLTVLVPSQQTAEEYNEFFETKSVKPVILRVDVPNKFKKPRPATDFKTIRFFISGRPLDGRKGQLLFLAALKLFETTYQAKSPGKYRPYTLDLLSIGNDYISEQIREIGTAFLGHKLRIHSVVDRTKALEITSECNVTVCCSLNESFALYVAEGMLMNHPILRNNSSGWQEQIKDGQNGFKFDLNSVDGLAKAISKILDVTLSESKLSSMGAESQKIATAFTEANYYQQIFNKNA